MLRNIQKKRVMVLLFLVLLFSFAFNLSSVNALDSASEDNNVTIYFFWGEGCPHCETEKPFLEEWVEKYPEVDVKSYETWKNQENVPLFQEVAKAYGIQARGVPTTFIGEKHWVGFSSSMAPEIEEYIQYCIENKCEDYAEGVISEFQSEVDSEEFIQENQSVAEICIHVFLDDCPQCQNIETYLEDLNEKYDIEIEKYDVNEDENEKIFQEFKENYGLKVSLYPTIFIGDSYLMGEEPIKTALESEINKCLEEGCPCPLSKVRPFTPITAKPEDVTSGENQTINIPLFGEVELSSMSAGVATALIAFVDGFNPCSLWVLTFLLGIVIYTGSRKKIVIVGLTFLLVTTLGYGLFMLGLLNVFMYVGHLLWIKVLVGLIAGIFAIVNIKDYFWYKKGISFTISDKYKPKIFKQVRDMMNPNRSTGSMVLATAIMAAGIILVELPCTAGFPVIWSNMMADYSLAFTAFASLFLLYLAIYLLDELIVFGTVAFTLKATKFQEKHGRILKLIGGMIMLALAIVLVFKSELMNDIGGILVVFGAAIALSFIIILLHRKVLPKFGINIGTEELENKTLNEKGKENSKDSKESEEKSDKKDEDSRDKKDNKKQEKDKEASKESKKENIKKDKNNENNKEEEKNE